MKKYIIDKDDIKAGITEWGSEENPTIICFHGLGSTNLSFLELGEMLKYSYHIISIDAPGHGDSPSFCKDEDYRMPNMVKWFNKVISNITLDDFYLLAHSWGGHVAMYYASEHSERIKKIMLLDGGYHDKETSYKYNKSLNRKFMSSLEDEIEYYEKDFNEYIFSSMEEHLALEENNYLRWSPLLKEASKDLMREDNGKFRYHADGDTARGIIKSMYNYPTREIYDKLSNEIILLQSTLPEKMEEIRDIQVKKFKEGTGAMVRRLEGSTHMIHWDNPYEVGNEIVKWFK